MSKEITGYRVQLEDKGQDFTAFITDKDGIIQEAIPFQTEFWEGGLIPIEMQKVGDLCMINKPGVIEYGFLKYKVTNITELTEEQKMGELDMSGYKADAKGALIPLHLIKEIDLERDALVCDLFAKAEALNQAMSEFKAAAFGDIGAFVELSAEKYGAKVGGTKGNVTLFSFDGRYKIQRAVNEYMQFDERILAAKALIDECLHDWTSNARSEIKVLIDRAFEVDKQGNLSTNRILGLRRVDIKDARWVSAMEAINESVQIVGSKSYVRFYQRVGDTDQYEPLTLDFARV